MLKKIVVINIIIFKYGDCSSIGRVPDCESRVRGFDSPLTPKSVIKEFITYLSDIFRDVVQLVRMGGLGPSGRRFESCHPDCVSCRCW